ncbi:hypothetical protein HYFRA_00009541 [Hymenoscyphus fraxineus]|uniref:Uncharacterized protein n=1 Tax=Hymenoscyphus fraxineus TaxID=746836 RepID=A0A9N9L1Z4_9HELO|nr:hypothetical protein HYFRA_00009541 [Hymenoscyphus fraxineus]
MKMHDQPLTSSPGGVRQTPAERAKDLYIGKEKKPERNKASRAPSKRWHRVSDGASLIVAAESARNIQNFCPQPICPQTFNLQSKRDWLGYEKDIVPRTLSRVLGAWIHSSARTKSQESNIAENKSLGNILKMYSTKLRNVQLPQFLNDPPPPLVLVACVSFAFAITAYRHSHRNDRYQDHITGTAILVGLSISIMLGDLLALKTLLPWCTIGGLFLSSLGHRFLTIWPREEDDEQEFGTIEEKLEHADGFCGVMLTEKKGLRMNEVVHESMRSV